VTETVQAHWLSFIKNGTPLPSWPTYSTENRETLIIDAPTRVANDPNGDRRQAWTGYQRPR
jgi:para-nitrobenzyl esterase